MLLKFCGMKRQEDLDQAADLNATHCGFIFHRESPRYISPEKAASLQTRDMLRTGVFTTHSIGEIKDIVHSAKLDMIQLHGRQSPEYAMLLGPERIIKVLWPQNLADDEFSEELEKWSGNCAMFLLDAGKSGGGSGQCLPWRKLDSLMGSHSWLLAGGLCPDNLARALAECSPSGIDVNSGIETAPGVKDRKAMAMTAKIITEKDMLK